MQFSRHSRGSTRAVRRPPSAVCRLWIAAQPLAVIQSVKLSYIEIDSFRFSPRDLACLCARTMSTKRHAHALAVIIALAFVQLSSCQTPWEVRVDSPSALLTAHSTYRILPYTAVLSPRKLSARFRAPTATGGRLWLAMP